jgi:Lon protease-like protein
MLEYPEFAADLTGFTGLAPVFPLPNAVLFPHVALPLHIFEPRYRRMVADALEGNSLMALALLKPGGHDDPNGRPSFHEMVCLGRITTHERLPTGRYNIVLTGIHRAVVVAETDGDLPYRVCRLELYRDFYADPPQCNRAARQRDLLREFGRIFPRSTARSLLHQVLEADLPLGVLCDLLSAAIRLEPHERQLLLDELDVDARSELLLAHLRRLADLHASEAGQRPYPPTFSVN